MSQALKEIHEKTLRMFDAIDEVVYVADPDSYELLYTNEKFNSIWGNIIQNKGKKCYQVIQNLDSPCSFCTNDIIFKKKPGKTHIWEFQNEVTKEWYRCYDKAIDWIDGKKVRMEMALDITKEKIAQLKLEESEERYKLAEEATQQGIWDWDLLTNEVYYSPVWKQQIGYKEHELANEFKTWEDHLHPDDKEACLKKVNEYVMNPSGKFIIDFRFKHKKGHYVWIHNEAAAKINDEGKLIRMFGTHSDISIKKAKDEDLYLKNIVFDSGISANSIANPEGIMTKVNDAFLKLWGYTTKNEVNGRPISEFIFLKEEADLILNGLQNHGVWQGNYTALKKDGSTFIAQSSTSLIKDIEGKIIGYQSSVYDVTESKNAEKKIHESERKFHALYDNAPDMYVSVSPLTAEILECNNTLLEKLGYARDEIIGAPIFKVYDESVLPQVNEAFDEFKEKRELRNVELILKRKDGSTIDVSLNVNSVLDEEGNILKSMSSWRDISALKKKENQILEEKLFNETLINSLPGIFYLFDANGRFYNWNDSLSKLSGKSDEEIAKSSPLDFIAKYDREKVQTAIQKAFEKGKVFVEADFLSKRNKAIPFYFSVVRLIKDKIPLVLGVGIDISKRKKAEEKLIQASDELKRSNIELERFASVASHDLQEPLRMVSSYTQLLEKRYKDQIDEKANRYIQYAVSGAQRMQILINDLLQYSRISTRGESSVKTDINEIVNEALINLQSKIDSSKAKIHYKDLPILMADKAQLTRLFMNLLGNSLKFCKTDTHPVITISAKSIKGFWKFTIEDNGIGIDEKYNDKIFVIFQRLHAIDQYEGTGIGLAICKRIVERHEGEIWVESTPDVGTTFHFTLKKHKLK